MQIYQQHYGENVETKQKDMRLNYKQCIGKLIPMVERRLKTHTLNRLMIPFSIQVLKNSMSSLQLSRIYCTFHE